MRLLLGLCLALFMSLALAGRDAEVSSLEMVDIEEVAPVDLSYGEGHNRGLLQGPGPYTPQVTTTGSTKVSNKLFCSDYWVQSRGGGGPNAAFRQGLQQIAKAAATSCQISTAGVQRFLRQISIVCKNTGTATPGVSFTKNVRHKGTSKSIAVPAHRTCFAKAMNTAINDGTYACAVKALLPSGSPWTPSGCP